MFCRFCGAQNHDDMNFCTKCGKPLAQSVNQEQQPAANLSEETSEPVRKKESEETGEPVQKKTIDKTVMVIIAMVAAFFVIIGLFFSIVSGIGKNSGETAEDGGGQERTANIGDNIQVGDVVTLGVYEQDGNVTNDKEPLEWDVVAEENGRYLLLSHYVIDYMAYDDGRADDTLAANEEASDAYCTWSASTLRSWCNGTFYNEAFSEDEKSYICEVTNRTGDWIDINDGKLGSNQVGYEAGKGGPDTQDKVFLLSVEEIRKYFGADIQDRGNESLNPYLIYIPRLLASPTQYAVDNGCYTYSVEDTFVGLKLNEDGYDQTYGEEGAWNRYYYGNVHKDYTDLGYFATYGFRSPGGFVDNTSFIIIQTWGNLATFDAASPQDKVGVRPAMWIECR